MTVVLDVVVRCMTHYRTERRHEFCPSLCMVRQRESRKTNSPGKRQLQYRRSNQVNVYQRSSCRERRWDNGSHRVQPQGSRWQILGTEGNNERYDFLLLFCFSSQFYSSRLYHYYFTLYPSHLHSWSCVRIFCTLKALASLCVCTNF